MSVQEVVGMTFFLLLGGYITTFGSFGTAVLALLKIRRRPVNCGKTPNSFPTRSKNSSAGTAQLKTPSGDSPSKTLKSLERESTRATR